MITCSGLEPFSGHCEKNSRRRMSHECPLRPPIILNTRQHERNGPGRNGSLFRSLGNTQSQSILILGAGGVAWCNAFLYGAAVFSQCTEPTQNGKRSLPQVQHGIMYSNQSTHGCDSQCFVPVHRTCDRRTGNAGYHKHGHGSRW